jgi:hypothetical protein
VNWIGKQPNVFNYRTHNRPLDTLVNREVFPTDSYEKIGAFEIQQPLHIKVVSFLGKVA